MNISNKGFNSYYVVGMIDKDLSNLVDFNYTGKVYAAPGVIKHIKKRHGNQLNNDILKDLISTIKIIIEFPDYIGTHPKKKGLGVELVKKLDDNLLVGIEVDQSSGYIYVATMYPITQSKIDNRVHSGRLKRIAL